MTTIDKVNELLKELSGMDEVKPKDHLKNDLALDSLLMVTLLVEIEDVFQIQLNESDMNPFDLNTVQDVVDLIDKYCGDRYE